jgi:hypothetical protein
MVCEAHRRDSASVRIESSRPEPSGSCEDHALTGFIRRQTRHSRCYSRTAPTPRVHHCTATIEADSRIRTHAVPIALDSLPTLPTTGRD